jgi:hypothetical protein
VEGLVEASTGIGAEALFSGVTDRVVVEEVFVEGLVEGGVSGGEGSSEVFLISPVQPTNV